MADACVDTRNIASAATSSGSMYLPIGGIFGLVLDLAGSFSIGVAVAAGEITLTVTSRATHSAAQLRASPTSAALHAAY
jgi:hypothetical protein